MLGQAAELAAGGLEHADNLVRLQLEICIDTDVPARVGRGQAAIIWSYENRVTIDRCHPQSMRCAPHIHDGSAIPVVAALVRIPGDRSIGAGVSMRKNCTRWRSSKNENGDEMRNGVSDAQCKLRQ